MELFKEFLGEKHPAVAQSMNNVGSALGALGRHEETLECQIQALELRKELLDEKHPDVAESFNNVKATSRELGNIREVLKYLKRSLKLGEGI